MQTKISFLFLFLLALAHTAFGNEARALLARQAVSSNSAEAVAAITELRALGPSGMETLRQQYASEIQKHIDDPTMASTPEWLRISAALDAVSQQKDSYLSGLYWYTDLDGARKAAKETNKPILSLRLLGKLTDELSCANSRFFRTVLYSNAQVSATLREHFILHWQSVRPVPVITIDFGNGRKLERTITGNSIHYVLDSDGRIIEALPGLYGPGVFLRLLQGVEPVLRQLEGKEIQERQVILRDYYRTQLNKISVAWLADTTQIGGKLPEGYAVERRANGEALSIMPLAVSKAMTEATILRAITAGSEALGRITDEQAWMKIAAFHLADAKLDARSLALIKRQTYRVVGDDKGLMNLIDKFEHAVALDSVRNEYLMHSQLYAQLLSDRGRSDVDKLNEKIYAEVFQTPRSDEWLGLLMADVYTGLENGGVVRGR